MVDKKHAIIWSKNAEIQLQKINNYVKEESLQNAEIVLFTIIKKVNQLHFNPERFSKDKYKLNNDGSFHAFEIYTYRLSFRIVEDKIHILRIRSTHQKPLKF